LSFPALVEKREAEPWPIAGTPLEPDLGSVDVGEISGRFGRAEPRMAVAVIGDDMTRGDIGGDALLAPDAVALPDRARIDEEHRLRCFRFFEFGDDMLRALVGREESTTAARRVIERQRDHLLRCRRNRQQQQKYQQR
jgi:hypothetical protein